MITFPNVILDFIKPTFIKIQPKNHFCLQFTFLLFNCPLKYKTNYTIAKNINV